VRKKIASSVTFSVTFHHGQRLLNELTNLYWNRQTIFFWLLIARKVAEDYAECKTSAVSKQLQHRSILSILLTFLRRVTSSPVPSICEQPAFHPAATSSTLPNEGSIIEGIEPEAPVELSVRQREQIQSAFNLFDTDGNGSMDEEELDAAMLALGFDAVARQRATSRHSRGDEVSLDISSAGNCINLANFTTLMQGELTRRSIREEMATSFARLVKLSNSSPADNVCKSTTDGVEQSLCVTAETLRRACAALRVQLDDDELQRMISVRATCCIMLNSYILCSMMDFSSRPYSVLMTPVTDVFKKCNY
jgi:Ca2+-binding EF-hand superfamily protein